MEVGPLARMLVAYASGHERVRALVGGALQQLGVGPAALFSTLGRVAARGIETQLLAEKMEDWLDQLADNMGRHELRIHDNSKWEPATWPRECSGAGFHEAPRGALGHWVHIDRGQIANYQCVVPSHLERRSARRRRAARSVRGGAGRHTDRGSRVSRWRSCARCIRSIRAWPAGSTSST